jgi:hypothetical protein
MAPRTRIQIAKPDIIAHLDSLPNSVFAPKDLAHILAEQRAGWRLTQAMRVEEFTEFLVKHTKLKRYRFPFPARTEERFAWGNVHILQVLLALKPDAYFSHFTAVRMHGLTEQLPKTVYVNHEQARRSARVTLTQEAIDSSFQQPQRVSNNIVEAHEVRVCLLNGMNTDLAGVELRDVAWDSADNVPVRVTNLERTLIDIAVRPDYAGGVAEVLNAYGNARDSASVNRLVAILRKAAFIYPYHQAIGFYLTRAGYRPSAVDLLRSLPMNVDFYLTHAMNETDYVAEWRIHVPKGF